MLILDEVEDIGMASPSTAIYYEPDIQEQEEPLNTGVLIPPPYKETEDIIENKSTDEEDLDENKG